MQTTGKVGALNTKFEILPHSERAAYSQRFKLRVQLQLYKAPIYKEWMERGHLPISPFVYRLINFMIYKRKKKAQRFKYTEQSSVEQLNAIMGRRASHRSVQFPRTDEFQCRNTLLRCLPLNPRGILPHTRTR